MVSCKAFADVKLRHILIENNYLFSNAAFSAEYVRSMTKQPNMYDECFSRGRVTSHSLTEQESVTSDIEHWVQSDSYTAVMNSVAEFTLRFITLCQFFVLSECGSFPTMTLTQMTQTQMDTDVVRNDAKVHKVINFFEPVLKKH